MDIRVRDGICNASLLCVFTYLICERKEYVISCNLGGGLAWIERFMYLVYMYHQ